MSSWSNNRKIIYGGTVTLVLVLLITVPVFKYFYKAPTCSDGLQNGNETGVDCGGSCSRLCQNSFLNADVAWTRFEEVAPHLYNIAAYIVNPNTEGEAIDVPYHLAFYDNNGVIITDRSGITTLPPHRNTIAFQGSVNVGKRIPAKALFEFITAPNWHKRIDPLSKITITDKNYNEDSGGSSLTATLNNNDIYPLSNISVYAVLYDKDSNAIGFSKTVLDEIPAKGSAIAPFTWVVNRDGKVISVEVLPVQE